MPYFLSQRALKKSFPQIACRSGRRSTYEQIRHITNDELRNEQVHKVENKPIDTVPEVLGSGAASSIVVERTGRRAKDQRHQW